MEYETSSCERERSFLPVGAPPACCRSALHGPRKTPTARVVSISIRRYHELIATFALDPRIVGVEIPDFCADPGRLRSRLPGQARLTRATTVSRRRHGASRVMSRLHYVGSVSLAGLNCDRAACSRRAICRVIALCARIGSFSRIASTQADSSW